MTITDELEGQELARAPMGLSQKERARLDDLESRIQELCDFNHRLQDDGCGYDIEDVIRKIEYVIEGFTPTIDEEDCDDDEWECPECGGQASKEDPHDGCGRAMQARASIDD